MSLWRIQQPGEREARKNAVPILTVRKSQMKFYGASEKAEATKLPNKPNSREGLGLRSRAGHTFCFSSPRVGEKGKATKQQRRNMLKHE